MNCLSSEDLKEERNDSLTLDATPNHHACQTPKLFSCILPPKSFAFCELQQQLSACSHAGSY
jgi:hypothetical protein